MRIYGVIEGSESGEKTFLRELLDILLDFILQQGPADENATPRSFVGRFVNLQYKQLIGYVCWPKPGAWQMCSTRGKGSVWNRTTRQPLPKKRREYTEIKK